MKTHPVTGSHRVSEVSESKKSTSEIRDAFNVCTIVQLFLKGLLYRIHILDQFTNFC